MKKRNKRFLGIFTFLPFVSIIALIALAFSSSAMHLHIEEAVFVFIALMTAMVGFGLFIYYLVHAINNKSIDSTERLMWILLFTFSGFIGIPVYYFTRVRTGNDTPKTPTSNSDFVDPIIK